MLNNVHAHHRQRLYNSVQKNGLENLQQHVVLEFFLTFAIPRKDTNPIAHMLLDKFKSIDNVINAPIEELLKVKGIGPAAATFLTVLPSVFSYCKKNKNKGNIYLKNQAQIQEFIEDHITCGNEEEVFAVLCDKACKVLVVDCIATGETDKVSFPTAKLANFVAKYLNAHFVLLIHTHPNTNANATQSDITSTYKIINSLKTLNVSLIDHIIVGQNYDLFSIKNNGGIRENFTCP